MKATNTYTQCMILKETAEGTLIQFSWLPTFYAVKDYQLEIRNRVTNEWESDWIVASVYETKSSSYVEDHERDYKIQRKASDI